MVLGVLRCAAVFCLACASAAAATWSGPLVDSKCYAAEERNVSPHDTLSNVDRDRYQEIWYCSPTGKTKSFGIVQSDGSLSRLDPAGEQKASELIRTANPKSPVVVHVTGEMKGSTLKVETISLVPTEK